jgi:GNAT superfamily N-acetyltransferase
MITVTEQPAPPPSLRTAYLNSLPEPQELFVENLVKAGICWTVLRDQREIGYAVIGSDGMLVELYLSEAQAVHLTAAFDVLVGICGVRGVLAKSFDADLLFVALSRPSQPRTLGLMYRSITDDGFVGSVDINPRAATRRDVPQLLQLGADFFDGPDEIEDYISSDGLIVYETGDGTALGAGVMKPVVLGRTDIDIGMVVHPEHRLSGHGAHIIAHLKAVCLTKKLRPICGCSIDNIGSQKTLERAGFASRHRVLEFRL